MDDPIKYFLFNIYLVYIMSCWKVLGSPTINKSYTTLKSFDGRVFRPYGILNDLLIKLEG